MNSLNFFAGDLLPHEQNRDRVFCMFYEFSGCSDQISLYICNKHASNIFGLIYKCVSMMDGNNDVTHAIVTYVTSSYNLNIPLFSANNSINCNEILTFCTNIANMNPSAHYKIELMASIIGRYLDLGAYINRCQVHTWFDDNKENSIVIYDHLDNKLRYMRELPPLHRMLFAYMEPSFIVSSDQKSFSAQPETVGLIKTSATKSPVFTLLNKKMVLKYTGPGCIATPLILSAARHVTPHNIEMSISRSIKGSQC